MMKAATNIAKDKTTLKLLFPYLSRNMPKNGSKITATKYGNIANLPAKMESTTHSVLELLLYLTYK